MKRLSVWCDQHHWLSAMLLAGLWLSSFALFTMAVVSWSEGHWTALSIGMVSVVLFIGYMSVHTAMNYHLHDNDYD